MRTPTVATLYTRPGCHLCEVARAELERLQGLQPHTLTVVDVSADAALEKRYGERIPVLVVGGREYAAPLPRAALQRALRAAAATPSSVAAAASTNTAAKRAEATTSGHAAAPRGDTAISHREAALSLNGDAAAESGHATTSSRDAAAPGGNAAISLRETAISKSGDAAAERVEAATSDHAAAPRGDAAMSLREAATSQNGDAAAESGQATTVGGDAATPHNEVPPCGAESVDGEAAAPSGRPGIHAHELVANSPPEHPSAPDHAGPISDHGRLSRPQHFSRAWRRAMRHWRLGLNVSLVLFLGGALAAPILAALKFEAAANILYDLYHLTCHQWAFRSFFLFGQQPIYDVATLTAQGLDPFSFQGNSTLGWKIAFCERDLAIYFGLLVMGLVYARRTSLQPLGFVTYGLLILPMALDGFTQLFGWRESTWQLRVSTGLIFGLASGWLVLPRLDPAFGYHTASPAYAADNACDPLPAVSPAVPIQPAG